MKLLRSVAGSKFRLVAREALPGAAALLATLAMGSSASASLPENKLPATPNLSVLPNEVDEIMGYMRIRLAGLVANQGAALAFENKWGSPIITAVNWTVVEVRQVCDRYPVPPASVAHREAKHDYRGTMISSRGLKGGNIA